MTELQIHLRPPHDKQRAFIESPAKRKVIRAGRRSGKTTGIAIYAVQAFLDGRRVLYATPTQDQIERFWYEVTESLSEAIEAGIFYKNETRHVVELPHAEQRIRAKTAWNADTLRGDYADLLILDEWQLMNEDAWELVGAPMLLDNDGDAIFIYTPPSIRTSFSSKARDKRHAAKLFKKAQADDTGRWAAFHFTSHDNPHISKQALQDITLDMTRFAYEQEILALDKEDNPGALWKRAWLDDGRLTQAPDLERLVIGVDPSVTATGDEWGIVAAGVHDGALYVLEDASVQASPLQAAQAIATLYHKLEADSVIAEGNQGMEMVTTIIQSVDAGIPVTLVSATRGKYTRAEPVSALYEKGQAHHVGAFPVLEDELCQWEPGAKSPNRLDALVWAATALVIKASPTGGIFI